MGDSYLFLMRFSTLYLLFLWRPPHWEGSQPTIWQVFDFAHENVISRVRPKFEYRQSTSAFAASSRNVSSSFQFTRNSKLSPNFPHRPPLPSYHTLLPLYIGRGVAWRRVVGWETIGKLFTQRKLDLAGVDQKGA